MDGEHPLQLGATLTTGDGPALVSLSRNFVPQSVQRAQRAVLYTMDNDTDETQTFYLLPSLPGEQDPVYFQGQLEDANTAASSGGGGDVECVAIFDDTTKQWTLEVVTYKLQTKLQRGIAPGARFITGGFQDPAVTHVEAAGANLAPAEEPAAVAGGEAAGQQAAPEAMPTGAFDHVLTAALYDEDEGVEELGQQQQQQHEQPQQQDQHLQQQEQQQHHHRDHQQQQHDQPQHYQQQQLAQQLLVPQQHEHPHQPHHHQQHVEETPDEVHDEHDDALWDDALPSLAAVTQGAEASKPLVMVVEDGAGQGGGYDPDVHHCSDDDDSDGMGMEVV